jgi:hypothetical protein
MMATEPFIIPEYELPESCNPVSMEEWLAQDDPEACRPCVIPLLTAWYVEELAENGLVVQSAELKAFAEQPDIAPMQLAERLDTIKTTTHPNLVNRLKELDCEVQVNAQALGALEE